VLFFTKLGLPVVKKTASGAPSTDEEVLEKAGRGLPAAGQDAGAPRPVQAEGHLHRQAGATGAPAHRPRAHALRAGGGGDRAASSSNDPNLQNIPVRTAEGRRIREAFIAPPGHAHRQRRLQPDRAAHHGAHQRGRGAAARLPRGLDVHRATASEVFGVALDQVSSEQRRYAKVINFGLIYGMSSFGLARNLGIETGGQAATSTATSSAIRA
jgi:DNA polymerase-1